MGEESGTCPVPILGEPLEESEKMGENWVEDGPNIIVNIENKIIEGINKGAGSGENVGIRPLRELIQNADDARSDRIAICVDEGGLSFYNDGLTMSLDRDEDGRLSGTLYAIMEISGATKKEDEKVSGNFGTGFRSSHLYSDEAEIMGEVIQYGKPANMVAICTAFSDNVDYTKRDRFVEIGTRGDASRPKRSVPADSASNRGGVRFRWGWREKTRRGASKEWDAMWWDGDRISELSSDFVKEIPRIIMGCRWIREALLIVNTSGMKGTFLWNKDFNVEEMMETGTFGGKTSFFSTKAVVPLNESDILSESTDGLISRILEYSGEKEEGVFTFYVHRASGNDARNALAGNLEPVCILIAPSFEWNKDSLTAFPDWIGLSRLEDGGLMPAYTPIALTDHCGQRFGPLSFLPPHESRTRIWIDGATGRHKLYWTGGSMAIFSSDLLVRMLDKEIEALGFLEALGEQPLGYQEDMASDIVLNHLPTRRPDMWFSDRPLNDVDIGRDVKVEWERYLKSVSERNLIPTGVGLVKPREAVFIEGFEEEEGEAIERVLESVGIPVISGRTKSLLDRLDEDYTHGWGEYHPLRQATKVDNALALSKLLKDKPLSYSVLGDENTRDLLRLSITEPSQTWRDSADRYNIPSIPDADGVLRPLKEESGEFYFFEVMKSMPDLLPPSRRVHPYFVDQLKDIQLGHASSKELARLVDEAVRESPERFENLEDNEELWLQVSKALISIVTSEDFRIKAVQEFNFVPCKQGGNIQIRRVNHVNNLVWGVDVNPGVWKNFCRKEFIFADEPGVREGILNLHEEIVNRISWLEMHPDHEGKREEVRDRLKIHKVLSTQPGANVIRSLIFGQTGSMEAFGSAPSMFNLDENGEPEIDKWIGRELDSKTRDDILETLLELLSTKSPLSSGWGNQSRKQVNEIRMLKGEDGEWHKIGELCYELSPELSELFNKKAILERHKTLLGEDILTLPVGKAGGCGLGIMKRVQEENIIEQLNSLKVANDDRRSEILVMMLDSKDPWELETLGTAEWIPTKGRSDLVSPSEAILPTPEMVEMFGTEHPWFIDLESDFSSERVRDRAKEIGLMVEHQSSGVLLNALLGPDDIWDSLNGTALIDALTKIFKSQDPGNSSGFSGTRRGRLPSSDGSWHDGSYVVSTSDLQAISEIFPRENVVDKDVLGSKLAETMAKQWIVEMGGDYPPIESIIQGISEESRGDSPDRNILGGLWDIVNSKSGEIGEIGLDNNSLQNLRVPFGAESTCRIGHLAFIGGRGSKSRKVADGELLQSMVLLESKNKYKEVLTNHFGALDLEEVGVEDLYQMAKFSMSRNHSGAAIERLWLAIALVKANNEDLLKMSIWPCTSRDGFGIAPAINHQKREALFPERGDSKERIERMIKDGMPMFTLPREGELMSLLYRRLESDKDGNVPFVYNRKIREIDGADGVEWSVLSKAIRNILRALKAMKINHNQVKSVRVEKTEERIGGKLYVTLMKGGRKVLWKEDDVVTNPNVIASLEGGALRVTVSTAKHNHRSDEELIEAISAALSLSKGRRRLSELVRTEEDEWGGIDPRISDYTPSHPRPLINEGIYGEILPILQRLYNCCQVCGRQTPRNRRGEIQEGVVSLFKSNGRYSTQRVSYGLGNALYLCPVHKSLHDRSLLSIPALDEAIARIRKSPEAKKEEIEKLITDRKDIALEVLCFERPSGEGEMRDVTFQVTWKGDHANRFRDSLAQYLGLVS
jgi:hypothetical protein